MIKFENTEVYGWEAAIRGMRNPKNSWARSDSGICKGGDDGIGCKNCAMSDHCFHSFDHSFQIGKNDYNLMMQLRNAGSVHRKYLRMITVTVDITAPLYWWKEFDTYKVGTVANSCSTMHKIQDNILTLDDFSHEHLTPHSCQLLEEYIMEINKSILYFRQEKDKNDWWQIIQLLPSSYNQKRTVQLNYEVLCGIYLPDCRRHHKQDEWSIHDDGSYFGFCDWIKTLPYSELITGPDLTTIPIAKEIMEEAKRRVREEK